ncbi:beta-ketoadipyl CoA thiolase [Candidatus Filomicrobium marinum]|uniref:acetyl-CoA C-acyltransferase n=2 Tax=Filomicrobium TaxID=119044 RepID=A0A0D6JCN1_9HYPH|nr:MULTISPECIES: acetyl-CoA C-acyltransferase [Filomicrobium]CFX06469.1 beta-ketoadipyl CoA thiolase [Candidatus Filomicrobium marinum]CPR16439.1 beta-ketoadipyl CoA thiolase [Candidatus Filomicrobium marinum]SDP56256.1 acetyl-CoA C-acetyltransferase [Filomicrobium insigne]
MLDAYLYDGLRTPFGRHGGGLAPVRPDDLLAGVIRDLAERNNGAVSKVEDVVVGCANQAGEDSRCVARHALLLAGLPIEVGGTVLQRNCGSGLGAIASAAHAITAGEGDLLLSGGVESMSRAAFVMSKADSAYSRNIQIFDSGVGARFPNKVIEKTFGADSMPQTADNLAEEHQISREQCDRFALQSQQNYARAEAEGYFEGEIAPVKIPQRRGDPKIVAKDEHPRETTMEGLQKLNAIHAGGVTTAGNASGINDGAVALLLGSRDAGEKLGLTPKARILSSAVAGVAPRIMGYGPVPASKKALERAGLTINDMDVIEVNEAFSAQVLACLAGLGVDFEDKRVNPNGGAIALGHPLGASGPRILLTAARQLERTGGRYGLISMCIGVGQGIAVVIERT